MAIDFTFTVFGHDETQDMDSTKQRADWEELTSVKTELFDLPRYRS